MQIERLKTALCLALTALPFSVSVFGQAGSSSSEITSAVAERFVAVTIGISARDPLVIAVCGSDERGLPIVCGGASSLEIHSSDMWRPASVRKGIAVSLDLHNDKWKPLSLAPGDKVYVVLTIDPKWDVKHGDQLRVGLSIWTSGAAMMTEDKTERLISLQFVCP